jgi:hypothetical protein
MSRDKIKATLGAIVAVVALSAFAATREGTARLLGNRASFATVGGIAMGPVIGWILAITGGWVLTGLWSLVPATLFTVGPVALWAKNRGIGWLACAVAAWVASGYLYTVAMWV